MVHIKKKTTKQQPLKTNKNQIRGGLEECIVTESRGEVRKGDAASCCDTGYIKVSEIRTEKCQ